MAIRTLFTRGYGNGTFNGTITLVVLKGYNIADVVVPDSEGLEYTLGANRMHYTLTANKPHFTMEKD